MTQESKREKTYKMLTALLNAAERGYVSGVLPSESLRPLLEGQEKPEMNIKPKWIPLAEQLPDHNTACIVGNVNTHDPDNPLLGTKWETATFVDRQKRMDETLASAEAAGHRTVMKAPLVGPRIMFQMSGTGELKTPESFTHWWPIPKPLGQE